MFKVNENTFDTMLKDNLRWFDIVVYNFLVDKQETIGIYDENIKTYDKETKSYSHYRDIKGVNISNLALGKIFCIKGMDNTIGKEINHCLSRLEKRGYISKIYVNNEMKTINNAGKNKHRIIIVKGIVRED